VLFLLTPYIYVDLFVRGDLSELTSMLWTPWPLYFLFKIKNASDRHKSLLLLYSTCIGLSLVLVITSHPATALFYFPAFCIFSLAVSYETIKFNFFFLKYAFAGIIIGLVLSSPYWLTVFQLKKYVNLQNATAGYYQATNHLVSLKQLVSLFWGFGGSAPGPYDQMSFQLGLIHFFLATVGFIVCRKKMYFSISYGLYLFYIFLMTPTSHILWSNIKILKLAQFPWRILSVTAVFQLICICGIAELFRNNKKAECYKIILYIGIIILTAYIHRDQFTVNNYYKSDNILEELKSYKKNQLHHFISLTSANEYLPLSASNFDASPRGVLNTPLFQCFPESLTYGLKDHSPYHLHFSVLNESTVKIIINQFYFPGWRVFVNGEKISDDLLRENANSDGLIQFFISSGKMKTIEAYYDGPPCWRYRNLISFLIILIVYFLLNKTWFIKTFQLIKRPLCNHKKICCYYG
jgi:hypothetical protein